jgi:hypothetical protein
MKKRLEDYPQVFKKPNGDSGLNLRNRKLIMNVDEYILNIID